MTIKMIQASTKNLSWAVYYPEGFIFIISFLLKIDT